MTDFENLLENFDLENETTNESLLFYAVAALITIVKRQEKEIKELDSKLFNVIGESK
jgi:hypothetical protein